MINYTQKTLGNILKHDSKIASYKIALLRAINDVALSYPDLAERDEDVAMPLNYLAEYWIAYYWPFVEETKPILQGRRSQRKTGLTNDMAFRNELTHLRKKWDKIWKSSNPSDGFFLINEMSIKRKMANYSSDFINLFQNTIVGISSTIMKPIRYAGPSSTNWHVFKKPVKLGDIDKPINPVPGTNKKDKCLIIPIQLFRVFINLSMWIEALCIHEWSLFTEKIEQEDNNYNDRGVIYKLLTARPDNRRPLTWERNKVDILLMEGNSFVCPWTFKTIKKGAQYDIDHLVPVSIYPINEMWNLVPSDSHYNSNVKRNRIPNEEKLTKAKPPLANTYQNYQLDKSLGDSLFSDTVNRFFRFKDNSVISPKELTEAVVHFINSIADSRNLERY